jgi:hypothetical protein
MKYLLIVFLSAFTFQRLNAQLAVSVTHTDENCPADSNATATANVTGGTPPYTYYWPGLIQTTQTVTGLYAGSYTVTVTDAALLTVTDSFIVIDPPSFGFTIDWFPIICHGGTGSAIVSDLIGATPPYNYMWMPGGYTTDTVPGLSANDYTVTITDAHGCTFVSPLIVSLTDPPAVVATVSVSSPLICSGVIDTLITSGAAAYYWSPANISGNFAGDTVGINPTVTTTYTLTAYNTSGCYATDSITINVLPSPVITVTSNIESGCSVANGSASISATGSGSLTYNWLPGNSTTTNISNVPSGDYTVSVTDNVGCITTNTITVGDSCYFIWPGDANEDLVVDNDDILNIGIAMGSTGPARPNATLNWIGQPLSLSWLNYFQSNGVDYKFADCDGNGTVELADTIAVIQNFGLTHNFRLGGTPVYNATLPDLAITMNQDSLAANSAGSLSVSLGNVSVPASNVYGLSFTLNFDPAQIDAASFGMNETGTWMGIPGTNLMGVLFNQATGMASVEIAITRYNHSNANGNGIIANLGFMTTNALTGTGNSQNVIFSISNVKVISANETVQQVNVVSDNVIVADPALLGIPVFENTAAISAFPNPFDESVLLNLPATANGKTCFVTLTDASGRIVLTQQTENSKTVVIHRGELESGIYFCSVRAENELIGNTKLIVK